MLAHLAAPSSACLLGSSGSLCTWTVRAVLAALVKAGTARPLLLVTSAGWESVKAHLTAFHLPGSFRL